MNTLDAKLELIKGSLFNGQISDNVKKALADEAFMKELYKTSAKQDIAHLIGYALEKLNLIGGDTTAGKAFTQAQFTAVYRYEKIKYELDTIIQLFEREKIDCILLKGSYLRKYYPEPWLRTSCDIDVLVDKSDLKKATEIFESRLGYKKENASAHDISLISDRKSTRLNSSHRT